jgi:hypothetical protein
MLKKIFEVVLIVGVLGGLIVRGIHNPLHMILPIAGLSLIVFMVYAFLTLDGLL